MQLHLINIIAILPLLAIISIRRLRAHNVFLYPCIIIIIYEIA